MIERFAPGNGSAPWTLRRAGSHSSMRVRPAVLAPFLLFLLSLTINLAHVDSTEFHPDETRWINRAHYLTDLLDPFGPTWEDQYLTRGQPPLGSYLMGLGLVLQGRDTVTNGVWDFAYGTEWNTVAGAMPEPGDLAAARRTNAVVGAATVVVVFFVASAIAGQLAATVAGLLLALHPLHIWISSQALSDQLLILIIALAFLTAIRLGEEPTRGRALLLGILLGLGGATKLSPMLIAIPIAFYGAALLVLARAGRVDETRARSLAPLLLIQPLIAFATFVVTYPYLWPAPISRSWNLFQLRAQEMQEQSAAWPEVAIDHPLEALVRVLDRLSREFSATGNGIEGLLALIGIDASVWGVDLVLAVVGIGVLCWLVLQRGLTSGTALMAFILAGQVGAILVGMQVDFYRYHLPMVLAVVLLAGLGANLAWQWLTERGGNRVWNLIPGVTVQPAATSASHPVSDMEMPDRGTGASINTPAQTGPR